MQRKCCARADETGCGKYRCHHMPSQPSPGSRRFADDHAREKYRGNCQSRYAVVSSRRNRSLQLLVQKLPVAPVHGESPFAGGALDWDHRFADAAQNEAHAILMFPTAGRGSERFHSPQEGSLPQWARGLESPYADDRLRRKKHFS
jgi:hypothetical protein